MWVFKMFFQESLSGYKLENILFEIAKTFVPEAHIDEEGTQTAASFFLYDKVPRDRS